MDAITCDIKTVK